MLKKIVRCFVILSLTLSLGLPPVQVGATGAGAEDPVVVDPVDPDNLEPGGDQGADQGEGPNDSSLSLGGVVVSQVLTGTIAADTHELIELFNNSDNDADISNWCVEYYQASGNLRSVCFVPESGFYRVILPARKAVILASNALVDASEGFNRDAALAYRGLGEDKGAVILKDSGGLVVDGLAWGDREPVEGASIAPPVRGVALERKQTYPGVFQDTNSNVDDFYHSAPREVYLAGAIYDQMDYCQNLPLIQYSVPDGMHRDEVTGDCSDMPTPATTHAAEVASLAEEPEECTGLIISEIAAITIGSLWKCTTQPSSRFS